MHGNPFPWTSVILLIFFYSFVLNGPKSHTSTGGSFCEEFSRKIKDMILFSFKVLSLECLGDCHDCLKEYRWEAKQFKMKKVNTLK